MWHDPEIMNHDDYTILDILKSIYGESVKFPDWVMPLASDS